MKKYDIFISYRRTGGSFSAKHLRDTLESKGYRVFFDVETLRSGEFNVQLLDVIQSCKDFIIILSPDALDRCRNEDDWVRRELECALENGKNIIPIMLNGFEFPTDLPPSLAALPNYNGVTAAPETYDSTVRRLCSFFKSKPSLLHRISASMKRGPLWLAVLLLIAVLAFFGVRQWQEAMSVYPRTREQKNQVGDLIAGAALNMTAFDTAYQTYIAALEESLDYLDQPTETGLENLKLRYDSSLQSIADSIEIIQPYSEILLAALANSPLDTADAAAMHTGLRLTLQCYADTLQHLRDFLMEDDMLQPATKETYISVCLDQANLDRNNVFYATNDLFLPLSDESLHEFKTRHLPEMDGIFNNDNPQVWYTNADDINRVMESLESSSEKLLMELAASTGSEQLRLDAETSFYEALYAYQLALEEEYAQRLELAALEMELAAARRQAYEKFRPLETDEPGILWNKGLRFITLGMPDAAVESFEMYARMDPAAYGAICGENAVKFLQCMDETGVTGGMIVCFHEPDRPIQPVQAGDIIYAVDGKPISVSREYTQAVARDGAHTLDILRFSETGYELLTVDYNPDGGRLAAFDLNEEA